MKDLTIILSKPVNALGKIITMYTKGNYSHSAIYFEGKIWESAITLSQNKKILNGILDIHNDPDAIHDVDYFEPNFEITEEQRRKIRVYLKENKGKKYPMLKLIYMLWVYPLRSYFNKKGVYSLPFWKIIKGEICCHFVDNLFFYIGMDILPDLNSDICIPDDLANSKYFKKLG